MVYEEQRDSFRIDHEEPPEGAPEWMRVLCDPHAAIGHSGHGPYKAELIAPASQRSSDSTYPVSSIRVPPAAEWECRVSVISPLYPDAPPIVAGISDVAWDSEGLWRSERTYLGWVQRPATLIAVVSSSVDPRELRAWFEAVVKGGK